MFFNRMKWAKKKHTRPVSLVLLYHRIADMNPDPWRLCVTPQFFAEQLEVIKNKLFPFKLHQLAEALSRNKIPDRSVAVTFDDGYLDNLTTAKPLLEQYGVPSTFFLSTGSIEKRREFWWDELESLILQPTFLPETLQLQINGKQYKRTINNNASFTEDKFINNFIPEIRGEEINTRYKLYFSLWNFLKPLMDIEREYVLDELHKWSGTRHQLRYTHSPLQPEQIKLLLKGELFDIGAHSVNHLWLPAQTLLNQKIEIEKSKSYLENLLDTPVTSFAYPYGDYTLDTIRLVKNAGFSIACSTRQAIVDSYANSFEVPRLEVPNCNGEEFEKILMKWFAS